MEARVHFVEGVALGEQEVVHADVELPELGRHCPDQVALELPHVDVLLPPILDDHEGCVSQQLLIIRYL